MAGKISAFPVLKKTIRIFHKLLFIPRSHLPVPNVRLISQQRGHTDLTRHMNRRHHKAGICKVFKSLQITVHKIDDGENADPLHDTKRDPFLSLPEKQQNYSFSNSVIPAASCLKLWNTAQSIPESPNTETAASRTAFRSHAIKSR